LDLGSDFSTDQTCECSSPDNIGYSDTPITDNRVCSETKPGSGVWTLHALNQIHPQPQTVLEGVSMDMSVEMIQI
ncbi:hypothetical protein ADUPG1_003136, partial [Aduncisulcus paluster]